MGVWASARIEQLRAEAHTPTPIFNVVIKIR